MIKNRKGCKMDFFKPDKECVAELLGEDKRKFIIPEYQRPYRWEKDQCETLWNDIMRVFGDSEDDEGKDIEEYFLGSIVAYGNENKELEIIDGQQRISTFILLFRAFYECFKTENKADDYFKDFGKCIWDHERNVGFSYDAMRLESRVAIKSDVESLRAILSEDIDIDNLNRESLYVKNYLFFYEKLREFKQDKSGSWTKLCDFILGKKLFILRVICDSQESAMTIFNTLNSRGMPLSSADILKGHIYKEKKNKQQNTEEFVKDWQELESIVEDDKDKEIKSIDFFFLQYMHIIRALNDDCDTTTPGVLEFFTKKDSKDKKDKKATKYGANQGWLFKDETIPFIMDLAQFWAKYQDYLSDLSCRYMSILYLFQNKSWRSFVSCLVWRNKDYFKSDEFDKEGFSKDFDRYLLELIKYTTLALLNNNAGANVTDDIVFRLNANILQERDLYSSFENFEHKYSFPTFENFKEFCLKNPKKMKYLLYLYAFIYSDFKENIEVSKLQIEHILPQKWQGYDFDGWTEELHKAYLEQIGNKILLDGKTNNKCRDNFFSYKKRFYKENADESLKEIKNLAERVSNTWTKEDIDERSKEMYQRLQRFFDKKTKG